MEKDELVLVVDCCTTYNLDYSFIAWLHEHDLIEFYIEKEQQYIPHHQLGSLEQFIRLHYELEINLEGIEAISHLLKRVQHMQNEINELHYKLRLYEREAG